MPRIGKVIATLLALIPIALVFTASAARAEKRIALVIGNAGYQAGALNTPANDAGLIAQTLEAAGFDVAGARDLDQDSLRRAFRDFLEKATSSGPDTVAFIYVSGYGLQLEGENYIVPIDAKIARDADVVAEALRISDFTRPLAALKLKAALVVLDAARANPFARSGPPLAGGLALVEPEPNVLMAFNAAPGTVAPEGPGPYGPYAQALAEMMRDGGLPFAAVFERARLRVNDATKGAQVPWHASKVETSLVLFERASDAPPLAVAAEQAAAIRSRPIRELAPEEAYIAALDRDTLEGYAEFLDAYPDDPMAKRVRAIIAARREALTWRRTRAVDTPPAYWSYLRRYPHGPHAADAHRRLAFLAAALEPPPSFTALAYDLPPPPPEEIVYIRRPVLVFDDPIFAFAPPPPPVIFLAPPPLEFVVLPPPPPPMAIFVLPIPVYRPVPAWVRPPAYVAPPPPNNVIYRNVHNTVVVNNVTNTVTITNPSGQTQTVAPPAPSAQPAASPRGAAPAAPTPVVLGPALPPSVAQKAATLQGQSPQGPGAPNGALPPAAKQVPGQPGGQPLPGTQGRPLPPAPGTAGPAAPSAAVTPAAPSGPRGRAKPGAPPSQAPGAAVAPAAPSAATTPGAPPPAPAGRAKPGTPPQAPAAKLGPSAPPPSATAPAAPAPAKPSAAAPPAAPSSTPTPGRGAKPAAPPHGSAARHAPPPPAAAKPAAPSPTVGAKPAPAPPPPAAKPATPPSPPPAAKLAPPSPPPPSAKPAGPPPSAKPAGPPPGAKPAGPPPSAKPAGPPPKDAQAKPKG